MNILIYPWFYTIIISYGIRFCTRLVVESKVVASGNKFEKRAFNKKVLKGSIKCLIPIANIVYSIKTLMNLSNEDKLNSILKRKRLLTSLTPEEKEEYAQNPGFMTAAKIINNYTRRMKNANVAKYKNGIVYYEVGNVDYSKEGLNILDLINILKVDTNEKFVDYQEIKNAIFHKKETEIRKIYNLYLNNLNNNVEETKEDNVEEIKEDKVEETKENNLEATKDEKNNILEEIDKRIQELKDMKQSILNNELKNNNTEEKIIKRVKK